MKDFFPFCGRPRQIHDTYQLLCQKEKIGTRLFALKRVFYSYRHTTLHTVNLQVLPFRVLDHILPRCIGIIMTRLENRPNHTGTMRDLNKNILVRTENCAFTSCAVRWPLYLPTTAWPLPSVHCFWQAL